MSSRIITQDQVYIAELIQNSYNISKAVIQPFTANYATLARKIFVNKNLFFGTLTIHDMTMLRKMPYFFNASTGNELFSSLFGVAQFEVFNGAASAVTNPTYEVLPSREINGLLFDDLLWIYSSLYYTNALSGSVNQPDYWPQAVSISRYTSSTNSSNNLFASTFGAQIGSDPNFIYAPECLYFSGYLISIHI